MTAKVILEDGRDAAAALVEAGWATAANDASDTIKRLAQVAADSKRGMYAEAYQHPPWTNY
jgi:endonuclease YncB( thermonuclease family)